MDATRTATLDLPAERQGAFRDAHRIGRYRLLAELGAGGMAKVSLAAAQGPGGFNKLVVIKQIHEQYARDPEFVTMFLDEARLAARLQHPNVVQTNEVGDEAGRYFIAMEFLEGQTLGRIRARLGRRGLPLRMHLQVLIDVLAGLHHAHELVDYEHKALHVVHRDANPENVFVTYDGMVKVVDFGIAKARDQSNETIAGTIKGKVTYMPPEQARGEALDRRADVFAVGVMAWEAATGVRMWRGLHHTAILQRLVTRDIPPPRSVNPEVPERLDAIIRKATAPDRQDRHATAAELSADLEAFLAELGGRVHEREIGQLVASHFDVERARLRARIQEGAHQGDEPLPRVSSTQNPRATRTGLSRADLPTAPSSPAAFAKNVSNRPRPPARIGRGVLIALSMAAAALTLAGVTTRLDRRAAASPRAAVLQGASAERGAVVAPRPTVTLRVWALPREAQLFLDDRLLDHNPFVGEVPGDDGEHRLRIEAPGHVGRVEALGLDKSRDVDIILQPSEPRLEASAAVFPSKTGPGARGKRRLDDTNPYMIPR